MCDSLMNLIQIQPFSGLPMVVPASNKYDKNIYLIHGISLYYTLVLMKYTMIQRHILSKCLFNHVFDIMAKECRLTRAWTAKLFALPS
jgi:hypothetical protein